MGLQTANGTRRRRDQCAGQRRAALAGKLRWQRGLPLRRPPRRGTTIRHPSKRPRIPVSTLQGRRQRTCNGRGQHLYAHRPRPIPVRSKHVYRAGDHPPGGQQPGRKHRAPAQVRRHRSRHLPQPVRRPSIHTTHRPAAQPQAKDCAAKRSGGRARRCATEHRARPSHQSSIPLATRRHTQSRRTVSHRATRTPGRAKRRPNPLGGQRTQ